MNEIIYKCNILNSEFKFQFDIVKVRSHVKIAGNEAADNLAYEAAEWAVQQKMNKAEFFDQYFNPIMVDIAYFKKKLDYKYKKLRNEEWRLRMEKINTAYLDQNNNLFYGSDFIFDKIMFDCGKLRGRTNAMRNEMKYLTQRESEIINKLRTEQINLNYYKYFYHEKRKPLPLQRTNGMCDYCNCRDSVKHFILDCNINSTKDARMKYLRNKLFGDLRKVSIFFKNGMNRKIGNILFPHIWQTLPDKKERNWKDKIRLNLTIRVKILRLIAKFVVESERFKNEEFGF